MRMIDSVLKCGKIKPLSKVHPAASNEKLRCLYGIA